MGNNERMCGRYVMAKPSSDLLSHFEAQEVEGQLPPPSFNVAPTRNVPIVTEQLEEDSLERRLLITRWGLVPSWAKDVKIGSRMINARQRVHPNLSQPSLRSRPSATPP